MLVRVFISIAFLSLLGTTPAQSANWKEAGTLIDRETTVYVDTASIRVDRDIVAQGWVRFDYQKPRQLNGHSLSRHTSLRMANCESKRYWISEWWGYPVNGSEPTPLASRIEGWQAPTPDSEDEIAVQALCHEARSIFGKMWDVVKGALPF